MSQEQRQNSRFTGVPAEPVWNPNGYDTIEDSGREASGSDKYTPAQMNRRVREVFSRSIDAGDADKVRATIKSARRARRSVMADNDAGYADVANESLNGHSNGEETTITPDRKPKRDRRQPFETVQFEPILTSRNGSSSFRTPGRPSHGRAGR